MSAIRSTSTGVVLAVLPGQRRGDVDVDVERAVVTPCLALPGRIPAAVHLGACRCFYGGEPPHTA